MSGKSSIQWTEATWNPIVGCTRVSAGCDHCYAATLHNRRYIAWKRGRFPTAPEQYHQPFKRVQLMPQRLGDPLGWRKPRRVFVNSMSDLFHEDVPDEFIAQMFGVMALTPRHTYQILTKRPERMRDWMRTHDGTDCVTAFMHSNMGRAIYGTRTWRYNMRMGGRTQRPWPLSNIWLGVSVEHQAAADERIPLLLETPAAVRFLSCEPLLGPVDLMDHVAFSMVDEFGEFSEPRLESDGSPAIKWVIVGGESGAHARPMNARWAESLVEQCHEAGVAVFVKQLGSVWAAATGLHDRHGGDMSEWPADLYALRVREYPQTDLEASDEAL